MALRMGMVGYALLVVVGAAMLHCTVVQTTHVVGDSMGLVIPPVGVIAYTTWASNYKFMVGDTLVFNFTTGEHDVAHARVEQQRLKAHRHGDQQLTLDDEDSAAVEDGDELVGVAAIGRLLEL
ncbi:hypothetical protein HHK36_021432 [Tetracentron sinense]|uniref:Phytocyanin domain-containing protein n=1 Tax=Tetracentron sinense TaxID=13715 RepID=A0A834YUA9_TETSI|nr:hypothetical protein HHK36_021432 [Tetracentron sinense]